MPVWIGTSGYNYPEWKGKFYPADLPAAKMLPYYAARFSTVEINYTFYRLPTEKMVDAWAAATPDAFRLTLKAPKRITHDRRLKDCTTLVQAFCSVAGTLGPKLGVLLFQLGPTFKKDLGLFDAFLLDLPPGARAAFEFRHASWFDDEVYRPPPCTEPGAVYRRFREAQHSGRCHRGLWLLPAAGRGLHDARHQRVGRRHPCTRERVEGHVRLFQARGGGQGSGVRRVIDGGVGESSVAPGRRPGALPPQTQTVRCGAAQTGRSSVPPSTHRPHLQALRGRRSGRRAVRCAR